MKSSSRPGRSCPRLASLRARGEWAEAAFLSKALSLGFTVLRPFCGGHRFDFAILSAGRVHRIQVKSTWGPHSARAYVFGTATHGHLYRACEVDFLAGYVVPEEVWYIIPIGKISHSAVHVFPHNPSSRGKFERYREAWHLLNLCRP